MGKAERIYNAQEFLKAVFERLQELLREKTCKTISNNELYTWYDDDPHSSRHCSALFDGFFLKPDSRKEDIVAVLALLEATSASDYSRSGRELYILQKVEEYDKRLKKMLMTRETGQAQIPFALMPYVDTWPEQVKVLFVEQDKTRVVTVTGIGFRDEATWQSALTGKTEKHQYQFTLTVKPDMDGHFTEEKVNQLTSLLAWKILNMPRTLLEVKTLGLLEPFGIAK